MGHHTNEEVAVPELRLVPIRRPQAPHRPSVVLIPVTAGCAAVHMQISRQETPSAGRVEIHVPKSAERSVSNEDVEIV